MIEMDPGTLVRNPIPCARVKMTLASKANSLKLIIIVIIIIILIIIITVIIIIVITTTII